MTKRRAPGTGCTHRSGKVCKRLARFIVEGKRLCPKHAADYLWSVAIKSRDGRCMATDVTKVQCNGGLQAAHRISRRYAGTRW